MNRWRLRAQIAWHRHGPLPWVAALLLIVGALTWAQLLSRQLMLQAPMRSVVTAVERERPLKESLPALVPPQQLNAHIRAILSQAESQGLELGRVDYRWPEGETEAHASRLQMGLPLRADYAAVKRFAAALLSASPAVSIDQLSLRREPEQGGRLEVMLWLSIWQTGLMHESTGP